MNTDRKSLITAGVIAFIIALFATIIFLQPSAEDLLVQALEAPQDITAAHAVVNVNMNTFPQDSSATFEVWYETSTLNPIGAFRIEVLEAGDMHAAGTVIAFNGDTLALYNPTQNKAFMFNIADAAEALEMLQDMDFQGSLQDMLPEEMMPLLERFEEEMGEFDFGDMQDMDPENLNEEGLASMLVAREMPSAEEQVAGLLEYANATKEGSEWFAGQFAYVVQLAPNPEQIPPRMIEDMGTVTLWISSRSKLPLGIEYSEGEFSYGSILFDELEINEDIDDAVFTVDVPTDTEIITLADLQSNLLGTDEDAGFTLLTPTELPDGATWVETVKVYKTVVQHFTLEEGGGFTIAMGLYDIDGEAIQTPDVEATEIELRGTTGTLFEDANHQRVLLTWLEADLYVIVAGDLTPEQAVALAESLE